MSKTDRQKLRKILREALPKDALNFYLNFKRLETALEIIKKHLPEAGGKILDLGCGPGVLDLFLFANGYKNITALDDDCDLAAARSRIKEAFNLETVKFYTLSLAEYQYPRESFELVIVHDVLWLPEIDFYALLPKLRQTLKPQGLLFFDIWSEEFAQISQLIGDFLPGYRVYRSFRRYKMQELVASLKDNGFTVLERRPRFSEKFLKGFVQQQILKITGKINASYFVGKKV